MDAAGLFLIVVRSLVVAAALGGAVSACAAEEAVDADGRATSGVLALDDGGRLHFTPKGQTQSSPLDASSYIRFPASSSGPFRVGFVRRLLLADGQRITGRLLSTNVDAVTLRTAWADRLDAPRSAVVALRQPPGWQSVFEDDFADGVQAWTFAGKPVVDGDPSVVGLSEPGQSVTYTPPESLEAGRVGVNFQDKDAAGARWLAELRFQGDGDPHMQRVTLAGPGDGLRVVRSPGWHRLTVRFSRDSLSVLCDDAVLSSDLRRGPGGMLRQVSIRCVETAPAGERRGRVEFTEFALIRPVDEPPRPPGDAGQDEVWQADGDQLFGDAVRIDRRAVVVEGRFGKQSLPWSEVRGCWFRQAAAPPRLAKGARVRLEIDSGLDPRPDVLDGVVTALDDKQLTLQQAALGELHVPRDRLRRLRPLAP